MLRTASSLVIRTDSGLLPMIIQNLPKFKTLHQKKDRNKLIAISTQIRQKVCRKREEINEAGNTNYCFTYSYSCLSFHYFCLQILSVKGKRKHDILIEGS